MLLRLGGAALAGAGAPGCAGSPVIARALSVLAWGRNVECQCGLEGHGAPLVARPTPVLGDLHGAPVSSVAAGKLSSMAVLRGSVYSWGDGSSGMLGLGAGVNVASPSRVEAFVGRAAITAASLGQQHALFLDADGCLWAAGENKEGQLGLGVPLEVLASQHRRAFQESMRPLAALISQDRPAAVDKFKQFLSASLHSRDGSSTGAAPHVAQGWGRLTGGDTSSSSSRQRWIAAQQQQQQYGGSGGSSWGRGRWAAPAGASSSSSSSSSSMWEAAAGGWQGGGGGGLGPWGAHGLEAQLGAGGTHPGQILTPARVLQAALGHPGALMDQLAAGPGSSSSSSEDGSSSSSSSEDGGLGRVVAVSASRYFSAAISDSGEVWTFGADYNGALGSEASSWQSRASRVAAPISDALAADGGAVAVAAGGTFCAALTAAGSVLVWGKLAGGHSVAPGLTAAASGGAMFARVALPAGVRATRIAAGQQHLLLADSERVWAVGRWLDAAGGEAGAASWAAPQQLLALPGGGVSGLAAGMHSSGAVDGDGQLWLWGRLMDASHGEALIKRHGGERHVRGIDWYWPGFGGAAPARVDGLGGRVRGVALGGWHALALVE